MRKYFQFAAWLVVTMLGACSGGTESKEAADTAMEDKPVVRLASVTSRDVDQIEEYTATDDDYSYDLLRQRGISPAGLATSFEKLAKLEEGRQSSMFDDHPASAERAQHIRDRMSADGVAWSLSRKQWMWV